ncbi:MAG: c-type cytochrome [Gemmatimonadota bacterium]
MDRTRIVRLGTGLMALLGTVACGAAPSQGVARGEAIFDTCVPCHGAAGEGNLALGAPAIAGLPEYYVAAQLQSFQANWRGAHPFDTVGIRMKSMVQALDLEGDLESVAQYVATLPGVDPATTLHGDPEAGRASYQVCVACHGPDGKGVEAVRSPPLVGQHDWYLLAQFQKFRKGWRGADPQDAFGQTMRPNSMLLDDEQVTDVIAYIQTLQ